MKNKLRKPLLIYTSATLVLAMIFFLFPVNLFDGVIIEQSGLQVIEHEGPLSLSYFIGMGYDPEDLEGIKDFYLTTKGWAMVFVFLVGIPALIAYRFYLKGDKQK